MERIRAWLGFLGWRRVVAGVAMTPLVAIGAWWMVQLPAPPVERFIPGATANTSDPTLASATLPGPGTAVNTDANTDTNTDANIDSWLTPLDTLAPIRIAVHVVGAVRTPGVYHLTAGARGDDALRAAGGPTSNADLRRVNLAATLADGEQLVIPRVGETLPPATLATSRPNNTSVGSSNTPSNTPSQTPISSQPSIVDLNRATADELDRLPGVGPSTARAIIDHRTRNGPFSKVDDLLAVRGIGPAKLAELRAWVRV